MGELLRRTSVIGSREDADLIRDWVYSSGERGGRPRAVWDGEAPEGWDYIGSGSFRSVWRSPDGIAYKVQHSVRSSQSNEEEYNNLERARSCDLPGLARLPSAALFDFGDVSIIAMELIDGPRLSNYYGPDREEFYEAVAHCETRLRLVDLHDENCVVDIHSGKVVIVDLGG